MRLRDDPDLDLVDAGPRIAGCGCRRSSGAFVELVDRGDIAVDSAHRANGTSPTPAATPWRGCWRPTGTQLTQMLSDWSPERHEELRALCVRFAPEAMPAPLAPSRGLILNRT